MATTLASLVVRVGADVSGVTAGLNTVQKRTRRLKKQFSTLTDSTLRLRDAMGILAGATGLAMAMKRINDLGSAVEESANKFNVVMGPAADETREKLEALTATIPLMYGEMEKMAAGTQDLLVPLGLAREEAAKMSLTAVELAGDLASFNNVAADIPLDAIKSALAGQSRPLRQFGVDVSEARLKALAYSEGIAKMGETLTGAQRAQAIFRAVQLDSADAMGDAARTADSAANSMRFFLRDIKQVGENMAVALVPAIQEFVKEGSGGVAFLAKFSEEMKDNSAKIGAWGRFVVETMKAVAMAIAAPVRIAFNLGEVIGRVLDASFQAMTGNLQGARETLGAVIGDFGDMRSAITNVVAGFDNMRVASAVAWETVGGGSSESGGARGAATTLAAVAESATAAGASIEALSGKLHTITIGAINPMTGELRTLDDLMRDSNAIAYADAVERANAIMEAARTPLERYNARMVELNDLLVMGVLNQDQYARAAQAAADSLNAQADAQDRLNGSLNKGSRLLSSLGGLSRAFGFAIPGIGQAGGILSAIQGFAGMRATGGPIPSGQWGIAGEAGPEKVVSGPTAIKGPAHVTPISGGGGGVSITFVTPDGRHVTDTHTYRAKRGEALNRVIRLPVQVATG